MPAMTPAATIEVTITEGVKPAVAAGVDVAVDRAVEWAEATDLLPRTSGIDPNVGVGERKRTFGGTVYQGISGWPHFAVVPATWDAIAEAAAVGAEWIDADESVVRGDTFPVVITGLDGCSAECDAEVCVPTIHCADAVGATDVPLWGPLSARPYKLEQRDGHLLLWWRVHDNGR